MRVLCRHGHFSFYPNGPAEAGKFIRYLGTDLVRDGDFYTFHLLKDAPRYSIAGASFLGLIATATYEGRNQWEVMRENGLVYSLSLGLLVPKLSVTTKIELSQVSYYSLANTPMIQPGTRDVLGLQIMSYDADFDLDLLKLKISEFSYE